MEEKIGKKPAIHLLLSFERMVNPCALLRCPCVVSPSSLALNLNLYLSSCDPYTLSSSPRYLHIEDPLLITSFSYLLSIQVN